MLPGREPGGPGAYPHPPKAYRNEKFLRSPSARGLRILAEYVEPAARFRALVHENLCLLDHASANP